MKIKKTSFSTYLWLLFFNINKDEYYLPNNYCPFFWKLVIAYLLIIPYLIILLPFILMQLITENKNFKFNDLIEDGRTPISLGMYFISIIIISFLHGLYNLIKATFNFHSYDSAYATIFLILNIVIILILYVFNFKTCNNYIKYDILKFEETYKDDKDKQPNLLIEFVKAKYNKYCPKIEWID